MLQRRQVPKHRKPRARRRGLVVSAGLTALVTGVAGAVLAAHPATPGATGGDRPVDLTAGMAGTDAGVLAQLRQRRPTLSRDSSRTALAAATDSQVRRPGGDQARQQNAEVLELARNAEKQAAKLAQNAWELPITRGVYRLTAGFGECSALWSACHTGLDFAAPTGTPLHAVANGVITSVGWAGAYGNRTVQTLEDGTELWYCHQETVSVRPGDTVVIGQVIGGVGSTGNTTGPHLHLEVRPGAGDPVDPATALAFYGQAP